MFSVHMYVWRSADNSKQFVLSHRHVESVYQTQVAQHGSMLAHLTGPEMKFCVCVVQWRSLLFTLGAKHFKYS